MLFFENRNLRGPAGVDVAGRELTISWDREWDDPDGLMEQIASALPGFVHAAADSVNAGLDLDADPECVRGPWLLEGVSRILALATARRDTLMLAMRAAGKSWQQIADASGTPRSTVQSHVGALLEAQAREQRVRDRVSAANGHGPATDQESPNRSPGVN